MPASKSLYVEMADSIKRHYEMDRHGDDANYEARMAIKWLVISLCGDLKQDNIHFNREKFLSACGISA